jgi:hypothetical protein
MTSYSHHSGASAIGLRLACLLALAAGACESSTQLGSACPDGVCPQTNAVQATPCLAATTDMEVALTDDTPPSTPGRERLCLSRPLFASANDMVPCRLVWRGKSYERTPAVVDLPACDRGISESSLPNLEACEVRQVTRAEGESGDAEGWYYLETSDECPNAGPAAYHTPGAEPPSNVIISLSCDYLQTSSGYVGIAEQNEKQCARRRRGTGWKRMHAGSRSIDRLRPPRSERVARRRRLRNQSLPGLPPGRRSLCRVRADRCQEMRDRRRGGAACVLHLSLWCRRRQRRRPRVRVSRRLHVRGGAPTRPRRGQLLRPQRRALLTGEEHANALLHRARQTREWA